MGLISGKCPECGAALKINEQAAGELTCPYCGSKYLVEKAINVTNITNNVVNNINANHLEVKMGLEDYETFSLIVSEEQMKNKIEIYESFGWKVKDREAMKSIMKTSWKITFIRNTTMKNYKELTNLYKKYEKQMNNLKGLDEQIANKEDEKERINLIGSIILIGGIVSILLSIVFLVSDIVLNKVPYAGIILGIIGLTLILFGTIKLKKASSIKALNNTSNEEQMIKEAEDNLKQIISDAKALL